MGPLDALERKVHIGFAMDLKIHGILQKSWLGAATDVRIFVRALKSISQFKKIFSYQSLGTLAFLLHNIGKKMYAIQQNIVNTTHVETKTHLCTSQYFLGPFNKHKECKKNFVSNCFFCQSSGVHH